jgi:hypothetical protein
MSTRNGTSGSGVCRPFCKGEGVMGNCAGIDWATEKHDVLIEDPDGNELLGATFATISGIEVPTIPRIDFRP